jgi:hypothetical protein
MHLLRCYYENGETKVGAVNASPYSRCTAKFDDAWQHLVDDGYIEYVDARHTRITRKDCGRSTSRVDSRSTPPTS